jgi:hypothetical protein
METLVSALKHTPIPTIFVISGIFFLILAVADQIAGKVVIDPSRRRSAVVIGLFLLVVGVALQFVPRSRSSLAASSPGVSDSIPTGAGSPGSSTAGAKSSGPQLLRPGPAAHTGGAAFNDSIESAKSVEIPSTTHEKHKSVGDKQYFKFSTADQPPAKIRILLRDLDRSNDTYPALIVFDPDDREIFNDWSVGSGNLVFTFSLKTNATYFILARQREKSAPRVPAEYDIVIEAE